MPKVPIACLLDTSALDERMAAWTALVERACRERRAVDGGVELRFFDASRHRSEVERLAAAEQECCGWADWSVSVDEDEVVLLATAADDPGPDVLRGLFQV